MLNDFTLVSVHKIQNTNNENRSNRYLNFDFSYFYKQIFVKFSGIFIESHH